MDFSKFAEPSDQWRKFSANHPHILRDGYAGNEREQAEELRQTANKTREATAQRLMKAKGLYDKVDISTVQVSSRGSHSIPIRRYVPRDDIEGSGTLVFFHGGGYLFGSETTDDVLCASLAIEQRVTVLSVIYRHTPAHQHPAQHDDAWDAFEQIRAGAGGHDAGRGKGIAVMGISAGAGLAAGVVRRHIDQVKQGGETSLINGLVLSIPWLIHPDNYPFHEFAAPKKAAILQCLDVPVVPAARVRLFVDLLSAEDVKDPLLNTAIASETELANWPKTSFLVAGMDPFRDDGLLFASRLQARGIPVRMHIYPGVPHGFRRWPEFATCKTFDRHTNESVSWALEENVKQDELDSSWSLHYE